VNILIVGASGNLGSHIVRHLSRRPHQLRLLVHKTPVAPELLEQPNISIVSADLDNPDSLSHAASGVDRIIYVAGVLFRPNPEAFLPRTNTAYVQNMVDAGLTASVSRFILISFPHVEENTTPESPALGRLDVQPQSIHGRTRLDAERYLFGVCKDTMMNPVVLRVGVIYGRDIKLIEAARKLMRYGAFAIWRKPTWVHLLALPDFLRSIEIAVERDTLHGIYNICDDDPVLLQEFVDILATHWSYQRPPRLPAFCFYWAATLCEFFASILHTSAPLTRDIVQMGMTSVVADTSRMKRELGLDLQYPDFKKGLSIL
jgi:nucleoside-diphosphate-sugar epimerase